jgi:hypothetical protein
VEQRMQIQRMEFKKSMAFWGYVAIHMYLSFVFLTVPPLVLIRMVERGALF